MSTTQQPDVLIAVSSVAAAEVKKFMEAEGVDAGRRRPSRQRAAGWLQRLQVRPAHRGRSRPMTTSSSTQDGCAGVRRSVLGAVPERRARSTTCRRCRDPASRSRIRTRRAAAAAAARSPRNALTR